MSVRDIQSKEIYVSPKSICEIFEIVWAGQQQKLSANSERWHYRTITVILPGDKQQRNIAVIPDRKVRTWICGINSEKVKPEVRPQLEAFQEECDQVLYDYWTKGVSVNPRHEFLASEDAKEWIGNVIGTAVEKAIAHVSTALMETTVLSIVASIRQENKQMMSDIVKTTLAEIRSEDAVYLAAKKWDIIERMNATCSLPEEQLISSQQAILNMLLPGTKSSSWKEKGLTHASEFLYEKSLQGYKWNYKTLEGAAGQLTKTAKKIWQKDNYEAFKEMITLKSGRTVDAYVFEIRYAEEAFKQMESDGKFYKDNQ